VNFLWLVLDIDVGILRRERSLETARIWVREYGEGRLRLAHAYRSRLAFEYSVISPDETGWNVFIARADQAISFGFGWAFELPDQFPYPTEPYKHSALSDDERAELRDHIEKELQT